MTERRGAFEDCQLVRDAVALMTPSSVVWCSTKGLGASALCLHSAAVHLRRCRQQQ